METKAIVEKVKKLIKDDGLHTLEDVLLERAQYSSEHTFLHVLYDQLSAELSWHSEVTRSLTDLCCEVDAKLEEVSPGK